MLYFSAQCFFQAGFVDCTDFFVDLVCVGLWVSTVFPQNAVEQDRYKRAGNSLPTVEYLLRIQF